MSIDDIVSVFFPHEGVIEGSNQAEANGSFLDSKNLIKYGYRRK